MTVAAISVPVAKPTPSAMWREDLVKRSILKVAPESCEATGSPIMECM